MPLRIFGAMQNWSLRLNELEGQLRPSVCGQGLREPHPNARGLRVLRAVGIPDLFECVLQQSQRCGRMSLGEFDASQRRFSKTNSGMAVRKGVSLARESLGSQDTGFL